MKSYLLMLWNTVDPIYYNFSRLHHVADHERNKTIFRVRLTKYRGTSVVLQDGTVINKHDLLLTIHLHNVRMIRELKDIRSEVQRALLLYHMVRDDLKSLSRYVAKHPRSREIKAVIGITMLNRGTRRLGFETFSIQNRFYRLYKQLTCLLINFIADSSNGDPPAYLFMSTNRLLNYPKV